MSEEILDSHRGLKEAYILKDNARIYEQALNRSEIKNIQLADIMD